MRLLASAGLELAGRTQVRTVRAEHAAFAETRAEYLMAVRALIEMDAGVLGHWFLLNEATVRARDRAREN